MSPRRALQRHRAELGEPIAVYHSRPGASVALAAFALWLLAPASVLSNPDPELFVNIIFPVIWAIILACLALLLYGGEFLAVCQRGLIIGSGAPFLQPYVLPYHRIVPGSVVPVTNARRFPKMLGYGRPPTTFRIGWWIHQGVYLLGPDPSQARRHRSPTGPLYRRLSGRWFAGTDRTPPEQVTAQIARAAGRIGLHQLAQATAAAPPRALTKNRADAPYLLPGIHQR